MAGREDEERSTDEKVRGGVGRRIVTWTVVLSSLAVIGAWASTGIYELSPGEAAVILRYGKYNRTIDTPGIKWMVPGPLEYRTVVNVSEIRLQEFGARQVEAAEPESQEAEAEPKAGHRTLAGNAIQTADNNIVNLSYVLQYRVDDAFSFVFGMADPQATLHDATQAAVREIVGRKTIDEVLSEQRAQIEREARDVLHAILRSYFGEKSEISPFHIDAIQLQVVQPPSEVQEAFDDVVAAQQDEQRAISEARGDARETLERANATAVEFKQEALAYKEATVVEARGEAARFEALLTEYRLAPEVTRRRLYLETMEEIMPAVDKLIIEPNTASMLPFFPMQGRVPVAAPAPPPPAAAQVTSSSAPPAPPAAVAADGKGQ